jgi:hypothetical protein
LSKFGRVKAYSARTQILRTSKPPQKIEKQLASITGLVQVDEQLVPISHSNVSSSVVPHNQLERKDKMETSTVDSQNVRALLLKIHRFQSREGICRNDFVACQDKISDQRWWNWLIFDFFGNEPEVSPDEV